MFEIAGLFLDDFETQHIRSVKSLSNYLDNLIDDQMSAASVFSMQQQIYEIQATGADALSRSVMKERRFDCKMGCDSCCHATDVGMTPAEAFYLANHIRTGNKFRDGNRFVVEPRQDKMDPCPLLKDGLCTVYEARPLSCRYILSTDLASCLKRRETLIGGAKLPPPFSHFRSSISAAAFVTLRKRGLDTRWLVLDKSIEILLNDDEALANWLAGNPLNETCALEEPEGNFKRLVEAVEAAA